MEFYEATEGNHIVYASYWGDGKDERVYYVNRPELWDGDPDVGMDAYRKAQGYNSFVEGSVESQVEEWTYLAGFEVLCRRPV